MLRRLPDMIDLDLHLPRPPFWMVAVLLILVVASWVPLVMIAKSRVTTSRQTKIHLFQDMDNQPHYRAQEVNRNFIDGRAMRMPVGGTVAWGPDSDEPSPDALRADDHYYRGYKLVRNDASGQWNAAWYASIPPQVEVDEQLLYRGQEQFTIYCSPCHGDAGYGGTENGPVNIRAQELAQLGAADWIQAANLHTTNPEGQLTFGPELYPDGKMFNTISHGMRNMPGYSTQIEVEDRWAIVAYVRALQLSQQMPESVGPTQQQAEMR